MSQLVSFVHLGDWKHGEVETMKYKVGDRVKCNRPGYPLDGKLGTIIEVYSSGIPYRTDFGNGVVSWLDHSHVALVASPLDVCINRFEKDHWYKWIGPKKKPKSWNPMMGYMLDGKPHKCTFAEGQHYATFDVSPRDGDLWSWAEGFEYFREVSMPTKSQVIKALLSGDSTPILHDSLTIESRSDIRSRILGI